jgi:hypothetical protein
LISQNTLVICNIIQMKYIILLVIGCSEPKPINTDTPFKDDINNSIIDGFYNNDTIGKSHLIYLIK